MGKVGFDNLQISCIIGVHPWEREKVQELIVDMRVEVKAPDQDVIEQALDYTALSSQVIDLAQREQCQLVETLAVRILDHVLGAFSAPWAWVRIRKPQALDGNGTAVIEWEKNSTELI
ncbi:MAG: dihydroneopterin aldolase [Chlamydiales bacterium]|nr:dihydroneopterin aldolase [Chlamydiales bacterium]